MFQDLAIVRNLEIIILKSILAVQVYVVASMRNLHLIIFFVYFFGINTAVGQRDELDSLRQALENHPQEDTTHVRILLKICYHEFTSDPEKSKAHAEEALRISQETNFDKGKGGAYRYMADYYWGKGNYGKATEYAYKMLRVFEGISFAKGIGQSYQMLGVLNEDGNGEFEKSKKLYLKALGYFEKANSRIDIGYCYNNLGTLCYDQERFDEASEYLEKSLKIRKEINDESGLYQTYSNLAHLYTSQKKYTEALIYFKKAIPDTQKSNNSYRLVGIYSGMGEMYISIKKYKEAEFYLLKSIEIAKSVDQKKMIEQIYDDLTLLEKSRNRHAAALKYHELKSLYSDSIYTEEKSRQIAEFETRFETEKKEQAILLLERDQEIKKLWINILVAAFILLVMLFVVVYSLQKFRERKNRIILNLEIDNLTAQKKDLSEKFKNILASGKENSADSLDQRLLKKAIEVVENNISNPLFGVEEMGKEMGMSRTNMHRKIKAITGFPPSELIRSIRLRKAAILLLNRSNTVSQVSLSVGFDDHSHFSRSFKKQFGITPSEYFQSKENTQQETE